MALSGKSKRKRERLELSLPVRVQCRESADHEWVELTRLVDVTPFGARFSIAHPTETGRLLQLTLPMPRQLRCFDHVEQQYRVWALVRNVKSFAQADKEKLPRFEIGVAFVGKHPPASFQTDPSKRYEVAQTAAESGLWDVREQSDEPAKYARTDAPRDETRHAMAIDVTVEVFDEKGAVTISEQTVTENISRRGAAVFTTLEVARGRFVRLTSSRYQIAVVAAVRARRLGQDNIPRLHLEFVDKHWPLEEIA